jgi:hypothetical protein
MNKKGFERYSPVQTREIYESSHEVYLVIQLRFKTSYLILICSFNLKTEAVGSSKMLVPTYGLHDIKLQKS